MITEIGKDPSAHRPRWHYVYFALGLLDLITVVISLSLNHSVLQIHETSIENNEVWSRRMAGYTELMAIASEVNAPGNDVFDTRDVPTERGRLNESKETFFTALTTCREDLEGLNQITDTREALRLVDLIEQSMNGQIEQATTIFGHFEDNRPERAASHMAAMDQHNARLTGHISDLTKIVNGLYHEHLLGELAYAKQLKRWEYMIAFMIVLMIAGITYYGHRLSGTLKAYLADRERYESELVKVSRRAGMAEVATGVLHNVGNVLNSVNTATQVTADRIQRMQLGHLSKASAMMSEHERDLGDFLTNDDRGKMLPGFLSRLTESLHAEQVGALEELSQLQGRVDHIRHIIEAQQSYARPGRLLTKVNLAEVIDQAIEINSCSLQNHSIDIVRDFRGRHVVECDQHVVLQVLVNLLSNAKKALRDCDHRDKRIWVTLAEAEHDGAAAAEISVRDNGVGITEENLTKIFRHGFTTRSDGHGFGLHSSSNAIRSLGGDLRVYSDGAGSGATFTVLIPMAEVGAATA